MSSRLPSYKFKLHTFTARSMGQRVKNHHKDMAHAHILESKIIPEMSVKPSALSQKRPVSYIVIYHAVFNYKGE